MVEKMETIVDAGKSIYWYIIIGTMSGLIQMSGREHRGKSRFEKFCVWLTSFCFAVFVTPTFTWIIEVTFSVSVPEQVKYGICFFSGQFGEKMLIIGINIYKNLDWKQIILTLLTKKKDK